jgi:hypothetical protein
MASKDEKKDVETSTPPTGAELELAAKLRAQNTLAAVTPPPPPGILDQLKQHQRITEGGGAIGSQQSATFGAWCRAKGVSVQDLAERVREGKAKLPSEGGDGPVMTEQAFEEMVGFKYKNTFGEIGNPIKIEAHADPASAKAAEQDKADAARKV